LGWYIGEYPTGALKEKPACGRFSSRPSLRGVFAVAMGPVLAMIGVRLGSGVGVLVGEAVIVGVGVCVGIPVGV